MELWEAIFSGLAETSRFEKGFQGDSEEQTQGTRKFVGVPKRKVRDISVRLPEVQGNMQAGILVCVYE